MFVGRKALPGKENASGGLPLGGFGLDFETKFGTY
jgi:hypothetical protein